MRRQRDLTGLPAHHRDMAPRPTTSRLPRPAGDLPVVLSEPSARVGGEADVGAGRGGERPEEVAEVAPHGGLRAQYFRPRDGREVDQLTLAVASQSSEEIWIL